MISFAGNITFPKAQPIRDAAAQVPLDRILVETDAPFLAPVPNRGKRNEPAWVREVAAQARRGPPDRGGGRRFLHHGKLFTAFSVQRSNLGRDPNRKPVTGPII